MKGEIEKRISHKFRRAKAHNLAAMKGAILDIIDEARKEFPNVIQLHPTFAGCMEYARQVKEWRIKWFGDEK